MQYLKLWKAYVVYKEVFILFSLSLREVRYDIARKKRERGGERDREKVCVRNCARASDQLRVVVSNHVWTAKISHPLGTGG